MARGSPANCMILKLKRTPGIYLVGFMASGKTTVGRSLAWELGWTFIDIDDDIEAQLGATIPEIFDSRGEAEFRRAETEALAGRVKAIERGKPTVIALGGGAFVQPGNFTLVENNGVTIWLDCPLDVVRARVARNSNRPLARDPERLTQLYEERREAYARADYRIQIACDDPNEVVADIMKLAIF